MAIKAESLLSATWINARVDAVLDRIEELLMPRLLEGGWLSSGYLPFEAPLSSKIQRKLLQLVENELADQNPEEQAAQALNALSNDQG